MLKRPPSHHLLPRSSTPCEVYRKPFRPISTSKRAHAGSVERWRRTSSRRRGFGGLVPRRYQRELTSITPSESKWLEESGVHGRSSSPTRRTLEVRSRVVAGGRTESQARTPSRKERRPSMIWNGWREHQQGSGSEKCCPFSNSTTRRFSFGGRSFARRTSARLSPSFNSKLLPPPSHLEEILSGLTGSLPSSWVGRRHRWTPTSRPRSWLITFLGSPSRRRVKPSSSSRLWRSSSGSSCSQQYRSW